ncbi:MAG TPA: thioredoxin domain-containing protein [Candidatus Binataceae bacterium]|nr:thioredoxin domain-containing protein [Candidatus Binataceae bacterium]
MLTQNHAHRGARTAVVAALTFSISLLIGGGLARAETKSAKPAKLKTVETDPRRDSEVRSFLQKHFKIPKVEWIKLGPATETPIKGIYSRQVTVTNDQGQSVSTTIYIDKNENEAILGQLLDLKGDPWGRVDMGEIHLVDHPVLGNPDAPVTIVEFADFECPYCAHAFSIVDTMINTTYKDKAKLIYKSYPLSAHPWALKAAEAAECARMQNPDAFWAFARYFYTNQSMIDINNLHDKIDKLSEDLKLDNNALKLCMASTQVAEHVKQDQEDGNLLKVNSTPTFFVNGIPVVGLPEGRGFDFVIDAELQRQASQGK